MNEQLELALDDVRLSIPWDGISPRALTKGAKVLFSKRERQRTTDFVDVDQVDIWLTDTKKGPPLWGGSPSLLPLPRGG